MDEVSRPRAERRRADGVALLGYAGLGVTAMGTEPGDWMARVIRGHNLPLEQSLGVIADAVRRKLPPLLTQAGFPSHNVVVTAFLRGQARLYSIDLARPSGPAGFLFRFTRYVTSRETRFGHVAPRVALAGSGASVLMRSRAWARKLVHLVKVHDAGRLSANAVAAQFARLNHDVHSKDSSVGPRCIVACRLREGGGTHHFFDGLNVDSGSKLPTIVVGIDINDLVSVTMPFMRKSFGAARRGETGALDKNAINAELASTPHEPDDQIE